MLIEDEKLKGLDLKHLLAFGFTLPYNHRHHHHHIQ